MMDVSSLLSLPDGLEVASLTITDDLLCIHVVATTEKRVSEKQDEQRPARTGDLFVCLVSHLFSEAANLRKSRNTLASDVAMATRMRMKILSLSALDCCKEFFSKERPKLDTIPCCVYRKGFSKRCI